LADEFKPGQEYDLKLAGTLSLGQDYENKNYVKLAGTLNLG